MSSSSEETPFSTSSDSSAECTPHFTEEQLWNFFNINKSAIVDALMRHTDWKDMEKAIAEHEEQIRDLKEENGELRKRLAVCEGMIAKNERAVRNVANKVTELQTRSMRDNLLIKNMKEEEWEDETKLEEKTKRFFQQELKLTTSQMENIQVERIHRIGRRDTRNPPKARNIAVKLNSRGKTLVMKNLRNLQKNSTIKVSEQFPPEVHEKRNKLWPVYISAKRDGKKTRWMQDQLQVDGQTFRAPEDRNKDINLDTTEKATKLRPKHTAVISKDNSSMQAHTVDLTSIDDVIPAMKALYADGRVSGASHVMYAYRVGNEQHSIHNYEDDGEWGSARYIMEAIQEHQVYNQLVCVTRWSGAKSIGRARQETVKELSQLAIQGIRSV